MTQNLSDKLRVASLIATCMVVLRHCANWVAFYPSGGAADWLLDTEWRMLFWTDVAVPFFFFVSGFLFMRVNYVSDEQYFPMLKKKFWALFVPFLIWNLIGGCFLLIHDSEGNLGHSFSSCLLNLCMSQWYGPLWYVRDVLILMVLYPLYGWLYKKGCQPVMVLIILWLMFTQWQPGWTNLLAGEGIVFFFLGGLLQKHAEVLEWKAPKWISILSLIVWIVFSFEVTSMDWTIRRISLLIGIPAFWMSLDLISGKLKEWCLAIAPYSFLIYVTHFFLQKAFKYALAYFFPENATVAMIAFFLVPILVIAVIIIVGRYWKRFHPKSYSISMGGRG